MAFGIKGFLQRIGGFISGGTSGSIIYIDSSSNLAQDNANLFYDATNKRVGIGTTAPKAPLHILTSGTTGLGTTLSGRGLAISGTTSNSRIYLESTNATSGQRVFMLTNESGSLTINSTNDSGISYVTQNILSLNYNGFNSMGGTPVTNVILSLQSTTAAFMPPIMTTTQKAAIGSPVAGMVVFDTTLGKLSVYGNGGTWETVTSA
jgi:hypothetical protein